MRLNVMLHVHFLSFYVSGRQRRPDWLNVAVERVAHLLCIRQIINSNFNLETLAILVEVLRGSPQSLQESKRILPQIRSLH
jgi:hypothetical protein